MPVSTLYKQIVIDISVFLIFMCLPLLALFLWGNPVSNGFWCNDQSLSFPYKPDTITQSLLLLVGFGAPFFVMSITEIMRAALRTKMPRKFKREMFSLAKAYGVFMFGLATTCMFTDTIKYSVGRLRPHFFDLCKPDFGKINCTTDDIARVRFQYASDDITEPVLTIPCGSLLNYDGLIVVHSVVHGLSRRMEYRQTYGNYSFTRPRRMKLVFLLGLPRNSSLQRVILKEHRIQKDIIQGNFIDAYVNLTYKAVMGFRWISQQCRDVNVVIKMDDDVILDIPRFFKEVWPPPLDLRHVIHCHVLKYSMVQRSGKWAVSKSNHKRRFFPPYCGGFLAIIPFPLTHEIYRVAKKEPLVWVDDAFIYGIVRKKSGFIRIINSDHIADTTIEYVKCVSNHGSHCKHVALLLDHEKPFKVALLTLMDQGILMEKLENLMEFWLEEEE